MCLKRESKVKDPLHLSLIFSLIFSLLLSLLLSLRPTLPREESQGYCSYLGLVYTSKTLTSLYISDKFSRDVDQVK